MWAQDLYGRIEQLLGAGQFAGNAYALLCGAAPLPVGAGEPFPVDVGTSCAATVTVPGWDGAGGNWFPDGCAWLGIQS